MDERETGADDEGSRAADRRTTRRRTLEGAAGIAAAGTIGGAGPVGAADRERTQQDEDLEDVPLVDAHCHLIPEETLGREPLSADDLVAWMDDNGVDRAVVLALDSPESYPVLASSPWLLDQVEAYPERLLPFCTIDPRTLVYGEDAVEDLLERYVERGARGFGELKAGVAIDDPRAERIYELCAEYELPILFHTDEKAMLDDVGLPGLEDVVASFPEVDFLAHAHGWWAHVAADVEEADLGDYPDGEIDEPGRVPELLGRYDNLYGDLSGISGWNAITRDPVFGQAFLETHSEQLIFGTDYIYPGQEVPQFELFGRFDLERSAREAIRYGNLEDVLR
jgi:uncharacterized protein